MPLPNRVTPFSTLVAVPDRGTLMGNRGRLHDPDRHLVRHHVGTRWISCLLDFRARRAEVWQPGRCSQLFFADEATALAAGHRPCAQCRSGDVRLLREAIELGRDVRLGDLDARLHDERLAGRDTQRTRTEAVVTLPPGTMIHHQEDAWLLGGTAMARWSPGGYGPPTPRIGGDVTVLTPPTLVAAIRGGYPVALPAQLR